MLLHLADPADRQVAEHERAIAGADQAADLQPEIFEDAAHLAVLAFGDRDLDPHVGAGAPLDIGVDRSVTNALDFDALGQLLELLLRDVAIGARAIAALDAGRGQLQLPLEAAVGGQQQQPLGIEVEPPDRHQPRQVVGQAIVDRRPPLGVAFGDQQPGRLVIQEQPRRFGRANGLAIDGHAAQRRQHGGGGIEHRAVERDAPFGDHPFDLAPAGDARAG